MGFTHSIEILADGSTPGVLEPGESERIPVYYAGWLSSQWDFASPQLSFSIQALQADNTAAENWAGMQASLQPPGINNTAWNAIFSGLENQLGTTIGGYVQMIDNQAAYLGRLGESVNDVSKLWNFAVQQASNSLNPQAQFLASTVDDGVAVAGQLQLTLTRNYAQNIVARDTPGPLGMGWSTSWQTSASVQSDGTVLILQPGGGERIFQPDSRTPGVYFSLPGDSGTLTPDGTGGYLLTEIDGTKTDYTAAGLLSYRQDSDGNRITAGYTGAKLSSLTASGGQFIDIAYNGAGLISSLTDSAGHTTTYTYDVTNSFLKSVTTFNGQTTTYTYNTTNGSTSQDALTAIGFPGGTHQFYTYDAQGRLAGTSEDDGTTPLTYRYTLGQVNVTDGAGGTTSLYYNENGQVAKMVDPLGNPTYYAYDSNFRLTTLTNSMGETASYTYNAAGQITAYTDFMGGTTLYTYGGTDSRLTSTTDPNGNMTGYVYNSTGDLLATNFANGSSSTANYDPEGSATSFLDAGGQAIDVTYNSSGQITQETFSDPAQYTYTYNAHGDLLTATDATGTTSFTYDPVTDMLTSVAYSNGTSLTFSYNAAGQRAQMVDQSGFVTNYHYDAAAATLASLTDGSGNIIVTYTYDAAGRLAGKLNGNGTSTTYTYDGAGHLLHLINFAADGTTIDSRFDYTYNTLGLPATQTTLDGTWTYTYDGDQRLTHAVFASNNPGITPNQDLAYTYDAAGNRTSTIINGVTTAYTVNDMNQYTNVGGVASTYDAAGQLTSDGTTTYTYGPTGQLASVAFGAVTTSFVYNALGQQISSNSNGQTTQNIVDPGGLGGIVGTLDGSGDVTSHMTYGLGLVGCGQRQRDRCRRCQLL